ncbi:MAG: hypothetical protein HY926_08790 [Elusimicrobia bacterium]|nr:hypothetical protein [Elusimicrobiota bacterium]
MRIHLPLCCAVLVFPALSGAWEVKVEETDRRIQQAQSGWKTPKGEPVLRAVLRGAKQGKKPGWARKVSRAAPKAAWSESFNGKTYFFGAGLVEKVKDPALRVSTAQDRARAGLAGILGEPGVAGAIPIDWYGDKKGALYALLVLVR